MDSRRVEQAARAVVDDFPFLTMRDAMNRAQASGSERVPCFLNREHLEALEALRAALDAAQEPAQAGSFVCERGGCGKNGRVDPYGAGPDCKSGGLSPAGSEPATATTIKPSAGGA